MKFLSWLFLLALLSVACKTTHIQNGIHPLERGANNRAFTLVKPFIPARYKHALDHTLIKFYRGRSDCQPDCPSIDIWKYEYRPNGRTLASKSPISTLKKHWKSKSEARILAVSLFGDQKIYYEGLEEYIESFTYIKEQNQVVDKLWGYETYTVRVYVAKRNPQFKSLGKLKGSTPDESIEKLLNLGCEVVYVDNHMPAARKDATFWRFMVAGEDMPKGQTLRYLVRDADWRLTAGELYAVGEWMHLGQNFHRLNPAICIGPLTAGFWGGMHTGKSHFPQLANSIKFFPYRYEYGDDELFTRDILWPTMKTKSILTHFYERGWQTTIGNPYLGSCEEPTQAYCDVIGRGGKCPDITMPEHVVYPVYELGNRQSLDELKKHPEFFEMHLMRDKRGEKVVNSLRAR